MEDNARELGGGIGDTSLANWFNAQKIISQGIRLQYNTTIQVEE
jgi:hypothetical protein